MYHGPQGSDAQASEGLREALLEKLGASDQEQQAVLRRDAETYGRTPPTNVEKMKEALQEMSLYGQLQGYDPMTGSPSAASSKDAKAAASGAIKLSSTSMNTQGQVAQESIGADDTAGYKAKLIKEMQAGGATPEAIMQRIGELDNLRASSALGTPGGVGTVASNPMPDDLRSVLAERMMREKGIPSASTGRVPGTSGELIPGVGSGIREVTGGEGAFDELATRSFTNRQLNPGEILTAPSAPKTGGQQVMTPEQAKARADALLGASTPAASKDTGIIQQLLRKFGLGSR